MNISPAPTSVTQALCLLPPSLKVAGRHFNLSIFADYSPTDIRVCYALDDTYDTSLPVASRGSWFNPYANGSQQGFLVLYEGVSSDADLINTLLKVRAWLVRHELLSADFGLSAVPTIS